MSTVLRIHPTARHRRFSQRIPIFISATEQHRPAVDPRRRSPDGIADLGRLCLRRASGLGGAKAAAEPNNKNTSGADDMTTQRLGLIMNGVTGRMGLNQHLIRSIIAIRDQGGVVLSNGDRMMPDPILVGRDSDKVERLAKQFNVQRWTIDLDEALTNPEDTIFFDAATTQARPSLLTQGDQRRQACLLREADRDGILQEASRRSETGQRKGRQARHGAGQAVSAGPEEAGVPARFRILRPHALGARRVRLLGVRRRLAAGAAAVVELPPGGRRRHHSRHGLPLALRAGQSVRRGREHLLPRHYRYSRALGREGQEVQGYRRRFRPMRPSG